MNVYEKLAKARLMFQSGNPKMSGLNKFAGYSYFELSDILPVINKIGAELGFICAVSFLADRAVLEVINTEKPEDSLLFTSPMSTASLKGCHEVQNLGAVQTYLKRYLYQNAFEIVESDALNSTQGKPEKQEAKPEKPAAPTTELFEKTKILEDWINASPPVFSEAQRKWAVDQINMKDLEGIKLAISKAVEKSKAMEAIPAQLF